MTPLEPPLFLLGAPRSGTSLLYKGLCLHPEVAYVSNWTRQFPGVPALSALNRLGRRFPAARQRAWFSEDSNAYVHLGRRSLSQRLFPMPAEGEPVFAHCGIGSEPPISASSTEVHKLRRAFASMVRFDGGRVFVNKRIANNWRIPLLVEAFPDARFVNIVRDGRAVASSLARVNWWDDSQVWWYGGSPRQWAAEGGDPWDICARNWVEELRVVSEGLADVPSERVMHIRYEEIADTPLPVFSDVAAFAGLEPRPGWKAALTSLRISQMDSWRRDLSSEAVKRIEAIQADELVQHGYALECP